MFTKEQANKYISNNKNKVPSGYLKDKNYRAELVADGLINIKEIVKYDLI